MENWDVCLLPHCCWAQDQPAVLAAILGSLALVHEHFQNLHELPPSSIPYRRQNMGPYCSQLWLYAIKLGQTSPGFFSCGHLAATHGGSSLPPLPFENTFSIFPSQCAFECFKAWLLVFEMGFRSVISMVCPVLIAGWDCRENTHACHLNSFSYWKPKKDLWKEGRFLRRWLLWILEMNTPDLEHKERKWSAGKAAGERSATFD